MSQLIQYLSIQIETCINNNISEHYLQYLLRFINKTTDCGKSQMKRFMPTKNVGLRRLIDKKYETISINEYNTSKLCCECHNRLEYVKNNGNRTFRHLSCKNCLSSENKKRVVYRTRDANSSINIMNLFHNWCLHKDRPELFKRHATKVELSVDISKVKS